MPVRPGRRVAGATIAVLSALALAACDAGSAMPGANGSDDDSKSTGSSGEAAAAPVFSTNLPRGGKVVSVDTLVDVKVDNATLKRVVVSPADGKALPGDLTSSSWTATERLEPGTTYTVKAVAEDADGEMVRKRTQFASQDLTLDEQTYASVSPLQGQTVGVGMPVVVNFDVPVTDKKTFETHMTVTTTPKQQGSWRWVSDTVAHWRPKTYWKSGTTVDVDLDVNGVPAGNGIYGQESRQVDFNVGDANIFKVDAASHQMKVFSNGTLLRTIPITTGEQPSFTTRSGIKVITEKYLAKRMNSETVGITGDDAYDIDNVQYAMRVTNSGEFIHAAPWSVGSQGVANVSHGCTGMSTDNAAWLYSIAEIGDVVEYTGTDRPMEPDNGIGDWNIKYADYGN